MTALWTQLILMALMEVKEMWKMANKVTNGQIKSLEELLRDNDALQAKIDAEK